MEKVYNKIFKYGFHDTEITSVSILKNDIRTLFKEAYIY